MIDLSIFMGEEAGMITLLSVSRSNKILKNIQCRHLIVLGCRNQMNRSGLFNLDYDFPFLRSYI